MVELINMLGHSKVAVPAVNLCVLGDRFKVQVPYKAYILT